MHVRISGLTKIYRKGDSPALEGLNLEISHGTFGILGPNGAGKTTLIKILSTQILPTFGTITIDGLDLQNDRAMVRKHLGYLPQHFGAYPQLSAHEFLDYMGRLAGFHQGKKRLDRISKTLSDVGLYDSRNQRTRTFSGGMMRRLGIAQAILTEPKFLIVDEPTVGLDPEERIRFRSILGRLSKDRTIIISTHIVGDISSTCENLAVLDSGRIIYQGSPENLVQKAKGKTWKIKVSDSEFESITKQFDLVNIVTNGDCMDLRIVGDTLPPTDAEEITPNLEDAYVYFMGRK